MYASVKYSIFIVECDVCEGTENFLLYGIGKNAMIRPDYSAIVRTLFALEEWGAHFAQIYTLRV